MSNQQLSAETGQLQSSGGATLATVSSGTMNTTSWQQPFTIAPVAAGTCTFVLSDSDTDVPTLPISVSVGS